MTERLIRVHGLVQGVGFRPHVWRLARALGLAGWVRNDAAGVIIAVRGVQLEAFLARLPQELPPLARVDHVTVLAGSPEPPIVPGIFEILESVAGQAATAIGPDAAICPACVADICNPAGRRWRHAFATCTHCGPRYTVSQGIPYDRTRTSLAPFPLCPACVAEYADPVNRRFHAETTCCPACGPKLWLEALAAPFVAVDLQKEAKIIAGDALAETLRLLRAGGIVAIKGLGGFHLACDADNTAAVAELRRRKGREAKPFAVMALNAASVADIAVVGAAEAALLASAAAPIVLCAKTGRDLAGIAPELADIGLMLPATPLHLLLWHEAAGRPPGTDWLAAAHPLRLVMTSANPGGEPLVIGNAEARQRLAGIADALLLHDREIVARCDDSLVRPLEAGSQFVRRSRGHVPVPIRLSGGGAPVLALGGYLKNTICVLRGEEAFLSPHVGSLDNAATLAALETTVAHLLAVLEVKPAAVAHDVHPDYPSTHLAMRLAAAWGVPALAVDHHAAHLAAIGAEHAINSPLIGLIGDGVGLGPDGGLWGGELLCLTGGECTRLGHLAPLALPGGDRAAREPWRMALSALHALGRADDMADFMARRHPGRALGPLPQMLAQRLRCPPTTSLGRVFDAAAGLLGTHALSAYEGQPAMVLEALARRHGPVEALANGYRLHRDSGMAVLDLLPLLGWLADCEDAARGAAVFHATLAEALENWLFFAVDRDNPGVIAFGGGCAQNVLLASSLRARLARRGCRLLEAHRAPPNDGGLALGQAWLARQRLAKAAGAPDNAG